MVVAVDESVRGPGAARVADRLAEQLGASVVLVHVVERDAVFPYGDELEREHHLRGATERAATMLEEIGPLRAPVERVVAYGDAAETIARVGAERDAALIVVGSRGRGAVKSALLGSVSRAILALADRPLVIVPAAAPSAQVDDRDDERAVIVCGVDGSEVGLGAFTAATTLAQRRGYELVVVHAADVPSPQAVIPGVGAAPVATHHAALVEQQRAAGQRLLRSAEQEAGRRGVKVTTRMEPGNPARALRGIAANERAAMIVVGSRRHTPLDAALFGSTSMSLINSASRPVMVVPPGGHRALERPGAGNAA